MSYATQADLEARFGPTAVLDAALADRRFLGAWSGRKAYEPDDYTLHGGKYWRCTADVNSTEDGAPLNPEPANGNVAWTDATDEVNGTIGSALADAGAEIDAALAASFTLPLDATKTWPGLRAIQCDLARLALFDESVPDAVNDRARDARSRLGLIASGERQLLDGDGKALDRTDQPRTADELPGVEAKAMVMTDDNLEGF